ncbi:RagB/SusD family nutrient uptake outer membrane protein [Zobellia nedashkovskayae]
MKTIKYTYIIMISLTLICLSSCQLAEDLDEYEPLFALNADTAITNEASAELALTGIYGAFLQDSGIPRIYLIPSIMSGTLINNSFFNTDDEAQGYLNNNPVSVGASGSLGAYTSMYNIINRANWLIEKVTALSDENFPTEGRRLEILAETKALRATANFYLLRLYGQFYDTSSIYGITLRTKPSRSAKVFPRNTVAEVYEAINADLDDAIVDAPDLRAKFYTSKTYAKGLKAKVLLYQGDYSGAAVLAKEVIDGFGTSFELAATYGEIFLDHTTKDLFESSEVLFGTKSEPGFGTGMGNFTGFWAPVNYPSFTNFALESTLIGTQNIAHDGTRVSSTIFDDGGNFGYDTFKFNYQSYYRLRYGLSFKSCRGLLNLCRG